MAAAFLSDLRARGFALDGQDGHLYVEPASSLTEADAERIAALKWELLDTLAADRIAVVGQITCWLSRRWDTQDDSYMLEVYGVCFGGLDDWESWLSTAPLAHLQRGLRLIEQEDAYLGAASPWREN